MYLRPWHRDNGKLCCSQIFHNPNWPHNSHSSCISEEKKRPRHNFLICSVTAAVPCGSILSSGGQSVLLSSKCSCSPVSSEEHQSHHPPLPPIFYSQCFPLLCELLRILFSSYPLNSETLIPHPPTQPPSTIYNIVFMSWGLDEG